MATASDATPDVIDHLEHIQKYATKRQVQQAYFATDGPRGLALATAAKLIQNGLSQKTWQLHQLVKWINEEGLWGEIPRDLLARISRPRGANRAPKAAHHADIEFCRGKQDGCKALGLPHDTERMLASIERSDGARTARSFAVLPSAALREANRLPKAHKKALLAEAREAADLPAEQGAECLIEMIARHTEAITVEREQARVKADDELNRRLESDRKLAKTAKKAERSEAELKQIRKERDELADTLGMLPFRQDSDVEQILASVRDSLIANVGNFDRAANALVAKTLSDASREDQPVELNELALRLAELGVNLWGQTLAKYLEALDPDQNYSQFWALNALFTSPGAKADIESFREAVKATAKKKGGRK